MYVDQLLARDFKSFRSTGRIRLNHPARQDMRDVEHRNVTVLLGDNGAGKSSILKALALGGLHELASEFGFKSSFNIRRPFTEPDTAGGDATRLKAFIGLTLVSHEEHGEIAVPLETSLIHLGSGLERIRAHPGTRTSDETEQWQSRMIDERSLAYFLVAYGADRQIELPEHYDAATRLKGRHARYARVASLLDPGPYTLIPPAAWLPESSRRADVITLIGDMLPSQARLTGDLIRGDLAVMYRGIRLPLSALSDGYQAFIGWVGDLLYHLDQCTPEGMTLDSVPGVVLVDEVDLHLHPAWQRQLVDRVCGRLPRLQFVFTTHSPLIVGGLRRENVLRITQDKHGESRVAPLDDEVWGRTPDQLLTDVAFGLEHTRDDAFVALLRRVEAQALSGDIEAARRLNALVTYGAGADGKEREIPDWIRFAARRRGLD